MTLKKLIFRIGLGKRFYPATYKRLVRMCISSSIRQQRTINELLVLQDWEIRKHITMEE